MIESELTTALKNTKSHKERRKLIKKFRRKKIRKQLAKEQEKQQQEKIKDSAYLTWLAEQNTLELLKEQELENEALENEKKFLESERLAQEKLKEKQRFLEEQERRAKEEIQKKREILEKHRIIVEEKEERREKILSQISDYILGKSELPDELKEPIITNPGQEMCNFFLKTGCCRFGDRCLKNHIRPGVSKMILIPNFFHHIFLDHQKYGRDIHLECTERELYQAFAEFYFDVLPEFEQIGKVTQFRVCYNFMPHLKGNVYVEFQDQRKAIEAYQTMYGRYYAGKKIYSEFVSISSWRAAICGLEFTRKCPKAKFCNFLHVFKNPHNRFPIINERRTPSVRMGSSIRSFRVNGWNDEPNIDRRNWRWSETPEPERWQRSSSRMTSISRNLSPNRSRGFYSERNSFMRSNRRERSRSRSQTRSRSSSRSTNQRSRNKNQRSRSRSRNQRSRSRSNSRSQKRSRSRSKRRKNKSKTNSRSRDRSQSRFSSKKTKSSHKKSSKKRSQSRASKKKETPNKKKKEGKSKKSKSHNKKKSRKSRSRSRSRSYW